MNLQQQLALYRQKFQMDAAKAEVKERDPFMSKIQNNIQHRQEIAMNQDLFLPKIEGFTTAPKEGYSNRVRSFQKLAESDPILNYKSEELVAAVNQLRGFANDPNITSFNMPEAEAQLNQILDRIDAEEAMNANEK